MFRASSHSGDSINTITCQMMYTLTANSPVTDMVLKSLLKELMNTKVAKKSYKQKYYQGKASVE